MNGGLPKTEISAILSEAATSGIVQYCRAGAGIGSLRAMSRKAYCCLL
jgi:hypothetical protein